MFLGSYHHSLDSKGRVAVPAQLRKGLPTGSVVAIGPEGRLVIRPPDVWSAFEQQHRLAADSPAEERQYLRVLYGSAREVELDGQGRLLLQPAHREWASIRERVVFIGVGDHVEVVGEEVWQAETSTIDVKAFTELNDRVNVRTATRGPGTGQPA